MRTGNKLLAIVVLILDIIKGYAPLIILKNYYHNELSELIILLIGSVSILGHIFPIWLKLKGGKGVATYIGFLFAINYIFGIVFIITWLIIAFLKKYSSLASIISLDIVINFVDGMFALMAFPTMISTIILAPKVMDEARTYFSKID